MSEEIEEIQEGGQTTRKRVAAAQAALLAMRANWDEHAVADGSSPPAKDRVEVAKVGGDPRIENLKEVAAHMKAEAIKAREKGNTRVVQGQQIEARGAQDSVHLEQRVQESAEIQAQVAKELAEAQAQKRGTEQQQNQSGTGFDQSSRQLGLTATRRQSGEKLVEETETEPSDDDIAEVQDVTGSAIPVKGSAVARLSEAQRLMGTAVVVNQQKQERTANVRDRVAAKTQGVDLPTRSVPQESSTKLLQAMGEDEVARQAAKIPYYVTSR